MRTFLMPAVLAAFFALSIQVAFAQTAPVLVGLDAEFGHLTSTSDDAIRMGMLTAIDEINAAGGVLGGRRLALVERDSRSVPARGRENFAELAGLKDLVAVFTGKFSPVVIEQAKLANELKLALLNPWAAADEIVSLEPSGTYTFRLSLRDAWVLPAVLAHLHSRGIRRFGAILPTSVLGRATEARLGALKKGAGPQPVGIAWYNRGVKSLSADYASLVGAGAQAILLVGNEEEGALLLKEMAQLPSERRVPVVSHWGISGGNFVDLAGDSLGSADLVVVQTFTFVGRKDAKAAAVVSRAAALFGLQGAEGIPSQVGFAHAYDLTHILARAIALAGSTDRVAIRDALENVKDYPGLVDRFARPFSAASHEALRPGHVFMGRFLPSGSIQRVAK